MSAVAQVAPGSGRAIALLALAAFASAATTRIADALLPQLAHDFSVTPGQASIVATAYALTYGLLQPVFGIVGDRYGKYRSILIGCVLSLATTAACALATSLGQLTAARLFAGFAAAGIVPLSLAWIGDAVDYAQRQATIARFMMGQITGLIAGQALGAWIGDAYGWRAAFWAICAIYVLATLGLAREMARNPLTRLDTVAKGASFLTVAREALARPAARAVLFAVFTEGFLSFGAIAYVTTLLRQEFGMSFSRAGLVLGAFGLGGIFYALAAQWLVRRLGERGVVRAAGLLFAFSFAALALTNGAAVAGLACMVAGAAYYFMHSVLQVNGTQIAPQARGAGMSMFAACFFVGQSAGVAAAAPFVDRYGARPVFAAAAIALPLLAFWVARHVARAREI